jgi:hypothetical protein
MLPQKGVLSPQKLRMLPHCGARLSLIAATGRAAVVAGAGAVVTALVGVGVGVADVAGVGAVCATAGSAIDVEVIALATSNTVRRFFALAIVGPLSEAALFHLDPTALWVQY